MNVAGRALLFLFLSLALRAAPVFSVGDIHGDIVALKRILVGLSLIDSYENWIGGEATLVTVGDHLDYGYRSKEVLDLLMKLETQAMESGGRVVNLLGNHEMMTVKGQYTFAMYEDMKSYSGPRIGRHSITYQNVFLGETAYARWFRSRPAMEKIGDVLYVHAGLTEQMLDHTIEELNEMITSWVRFEQGVGEKPDPATEWVTYKGPLWTRDLNFYLDIHQKKVKNKKAMSPEMLDKLLKHFGVKHVVFGHTPVEELELAVDHPYYGDRAIQIDTGITEKDNKMVTGFKYEDGIFTAYHFDRKTQKLLRTMESKPGSKGSGCYRFY